MRRMLEGVVLNGTGKTGASWMATLRREKPAPRRNSIPDTGHYSTHDLIASFVGFAPINTPAVTILVQLDSPAGAHEGGQVAAPVFKRVAQQVLAYLDVPRDIPVSAETLRASRAQAAHEKDDNLADVSDFDPVQAPMDAAVDDPAPAIPHAAPVAAAAPTVELRKAKECPRRNFWEKPCAK